MRLNKYLDLAGKTHKQFAEEVGVTPVAISNYVRGIRIPAAWVIAKIETITQGKVTVHDFMPDDDRDRT